MLHLLKKKNVVSDADDMTAAVFPRFIARGAAGAFGGLLCAAASALFLAYWFSAKEEVQGLKEVFQT